MWLDLIVAGGFAALRALDRTGVVPIGTMRATRANRYHDEPVSRPGTGDGR
jgi:hypothetical protein